MSEVLEFFRREEPKFNDVPDEDLTVWIGHNFPKFLQDPGFAKQHDIEQTVYFHKQYPEEARKTEGELQAERREFLGEKLVQHNLEFSAKHPIQMPSPTPSSFLLPPGVQQGMRQTGAIRKPPAHLDYSNMRAARAGMPDKVKEWEAEFEDQNQAARGYREVQEKYEDIVPAGRQVWQDVGRGVDNLQSLAYGLGAMGVDLEARALGAAGVDPSSLHDLRDQWIQGFVRNQQEAGEAPPVIGKLTEIDNVGDFVQYTAEALGENVTTLVPMILSGAVGWKVGEAAVKKTTEAGAKGMLKDHVEKQVAKKVADGFTEKQALKFVQNNFAQKAAALAAGSASGAMETGSIYGDVFQETGQHRPDLALLFGSAAGSLDVVPGMMVLKKALGPKVAGQVKRSLIHRYGIDTAKVMLTEGSTEALQGRLENTAVVIADPEKDVLSVEGFDYITEGWVDEFAKGGLAIAPLQIGAAVMSGEGNLPGKPPEGVAPTEPAPAKPDLPPAPIDLGRGERMPGREIGGRRFWRGARLEEGQKRIEGGPPLIEGPAAIEDTGPKPAQVDEPLGIEGPPAPAPQQKGPPVVEAEVISETQQMVDQEAGKVAGAAPIYVVSGRAFMEDPDPTDEIKVDLERLDAVTKGMNKNQRRAYIHGALHEGVVHNATFQSMHSQWEQEGSKGTFAQHVDNEAAGIVNEMTEVQKAAVRKIYGQDQMSNTEMAMEYTRILMQRRAGSKVTEDTWAEVHKELGLLDTNVTRNWLQRAIDWMRGREGTNLDRTIRRAEAALKKLEKAAPKKPATLAEATAYFNENDPDILTGYYKMSQKLIGNERASKGYERAVVAAYNHLQENDTLKDFKPKQFIGYGKKETRKEKKRRETVIPTEDVPETAATTVEPGLEEARAKVRRAYERAANEMFPDNPELAADMVDVAAGTQKAADVARKHKKNTSTLSNKKQKLIKKAKAYVRKEGLDKTQSVGAAEPVFHGGLKPEDESFTTDKIGTGEGATSFGWGLYFASKKKIAEWYKRKLGGRLNKAKLYTVDLAPAESDYLDWDKPLSEQSDTVKEGLRKIPQAAWRGINEALENSGRNGIYGEQDWDLINGRELYKALAHTEAHEALPGELPGSSWYTAPITTEKKHTSLYLKSIGIRGIRYLDSDSRKQGEGTSNYVIFDDADITVTSVGAAEPSKKRMKTMADVERVFTPLKKERRTLGRWIRDTLDRARAAHISKFHPLKRFQSEIFKFYGKARPMLDMARVFEQVAGAPARAEADIHRFIKQVINPIKGMEEEFNHYMFLKRTEDRLKADPEFRKVADWTLKDTTSLLAELESKIGEENMALLEKQSKLYQEHMDHALRLQVQSGRMSTAEYNAIKAVNDFYAPFKVLKYLEEGEMQEGAGRSIDTTAEFTKKVVGISDEDFRLGGIVDASIEKILLSRILAEKNLKMRQLAGLAEVDTEQMFLRELGSKEKAAHDKEFFRAYENGKERRFEVDKNVAEAVEGMNGAAVGTMGKILEKTSKPLKYGATGGNAAFQVVNLALADQPRFAMLSRYGIKANPIELVRYPLDLLYGIATSFAGNFGYHNNLYTTFLESGAARSTIQTQLTPEVFEAKAKGGRRGFATLNPLDIVAKFSNAIEETTKVMGLRRGIRFERISDPKAQAAEMERVVTEVRNYAGSPDFARMGSVIEGARTNLLFMFYNARVQGIAGDIARLSGSTGGGIAVASWARIAGLLGMPVVYLWLLNQKDEYREDYEKLSPRDKKNYHHIPTDKFFINEEGQRVRDYIRIPKREVVKLVSNTIEAGMDYFQSQDPIRLHEWGTQMLENISPISISGRNFEERIESIVSSTNPLVKAPVEYGLGRNTWMHRDTIPDYMKHRSPELQFDDNTPEAFKKLAEMMPDFLPEGMRSPKKLEQLTGSISAGLVTQFIEKPAYKGRPYSSESPLLQSVERRFRRSPYVYDDMDKELMDQLFRRSADQGFMRDQFITSFVEERDGKTPGEILSEAKKTLAADGVSGEDRITYDGIKQELRDRDRGLNYRERMIMRLQVKDGSRSRYLIEQWEKLSPGGERQDFYNEMVRKKIITKEVAVLMAKLSGRGLVDLRNGK